MLGLWCALLTTCFCYRGSLADGHVCIVPAEHVASGRRTDEAVWTELRNFKKSLLQMFMQQVRNLSRSNGSQVATSIVAAADVMSAWRRLALLDDLHGLRCMHISLNCLVTAGKRTSLSWRRLSGCGFVYQD